VRNTTLSEMPTAISAGAARLAIGAIVSYQILLFVLIFLRPDLDPSWHTISEWAIGPYGWLMSGAFLVSGMSYAALFVLLRGHLRGVVGRVGQVLLAVCMIGAIGVGLFTTDPMPIHPPLSKIGTMHVILGTSQLVLFPFAALLINVSLVRRNQMWTSARRALVWSACLPLAGFASFALYSAMFVFPLGTGAYGPGVNIGWPPRFAFFTYMLWVVTVGWQAIRCNHRFSAPDGRIILPAAHKLHRVEFPDRAPGGPADGPE
jgi:hypothetical membrane protein